MGQKRNRESDWKNLVLKTMQIRTEYDCNFICFIMPHYPSRPLTSRPDGSALCLPCAVSFRGPSPILPQPHVAHMSYAVRSHPPGPQSGIALRVVQLVRQLGYLGSMGTFDVRGKAPVVPQRPPRPKGPYSGRISG